MFAESTDDEYPLSQMMHCKIRAEMQDGQMNVYHSLHTQNTQPQSNAYSSSDRVLLKALQRITIKPLFHNHVGHGLKALDTVCNYSK